MDNLTKTSLNNWLQLAFSYGVGPQTLLKLLREFGSVEAILAQNTERLARLVGRGVAASIAQGAANPQIAISLQWCAENPARRHILTLDDSRYPAELAEIASPPLVLFCEGELSLLQSAKIAVVGTRNPSVQGIENAFAFARDLATHGLTVVSGLAAGIDKAAHEGALASSSPATIAVLGTGIDQVYPASNRLLYQRILQSGLLVSEFPLGSPPLHTNFPRRNRIIVGLSKGCLVVESSIDGGSMISANFALEMGREVMAIPGSIHNPMARGCHKLIKQGAKLIEATHEVLEELQMDGKQLFCKQITTSVDDPLLAAFGHDPQSLDELNAKLNWDFGELCGKLLELELAGRVVNCGAGRYQRIFK